MLFPDLRVLKTNGFDGNFDGGDVDNDEEYPENLKDPVSDFTPKSILKSSWEKQQIKTFTNWCNFHLKKSNDQIENFEHDFRDGRKLITLLQALTGDSLPQIRHVEMKLHQIANVNIGLDYIVNTGCNLDLIAAEEIVDGNLKMTLGLIWAIILHFSIKTINHEDFFAEKALFEWCRKTTKRYTNVRVNDFNTSFRDGLALCALVHFYSPKSFDYDSLTHANSEKNLNLAFDTAEKVFGVPKMIDAKDILRNEAPDNKSILTYVAALFHAIDKCQTWKKMGVNDYCLENKNYDSQTSDLSSLNSVVTSSDNSDLSSLSSTTTQASETSAKSDRTVTSLVEEFNNSLDKMLLSNVAEQKQNKVNDKPENLEHPISVNKPSPETDKINSMSRHYEERYYVKDERDMPDYESHRNRSSSRARSSSRHTSRHRQQEDPYYRQRSGSGSSCSSMSDYEGRDRPLVRCPRDVIRAPTPPPVIQRVVERAPTPEADVVERVIVRPQPQQLIERIIERPRTPPPRIIDKEICEPAPPPIVRTRIVKVDHSPKHYYQNQSSNRQYAPTTSRYDDYDYGSYSTAEAYPQQAYQSQAYPSQAYQSQAYPSQASAYPQQGYQQAYSSGYQGQASGSAYQQQPQQYYSQTGSNPYGYSYAAPSYPQQGQSRRY